MRVRWSLRALAQLRAIHAHIARDNRKAADDVVDEIEATAESLGHFHDLGMATSKPDYRTIVVPRYPAYRIFYRISPGEVHIVRVRDNRRRPLRDQS